MKFIDWIVKNKNTILFIGGIGCFGASVGLAIDRTPKIIDTCTSNAKKREELTAKYNDKSENTVHMTAEEYDKAMTREKLAGLGRVAKTAAPIALTFAAGTIATSVAFKSEHDEKLEAIETATKAVAELAVANAFIDKYRANVIADQGIGKDQDYAYGTSVQSVSEVVIDDETGEEVTETTAIRYLDSSLKDCPLYDKYTVFIPNDHILVRKFRPQYLVKQINAKINEVNNLLNAELRPFYTAYDFCNELGLTPGSCGCTIDPTAAMNIGIIHVGEDGKYSSEVTNGKYLNRAKNDIGPAILDWAEYKDGQPVINKDDNGYYICLNWVNIGGMIPNQDKMKEIESKYSNYKLESWEAHPETQK